MAPSASTHTALRRTENDVVDELFWLAKLDESVPRANLAPHFKRPAGRRHTYEAVPFTLEPRLVQALKSADTARGVSDVVLCASVVAVLFGKFQRHDALIVGLQSPEAPDAGRPLVPLRLPYGPAESPCSLMRAISEEVSELIGRPTPSATRMAQLLGVEAAENRCPFFDVAIAVDRGQVSFDFDRYPVDIAVLFAVGAGGIDGRLVYAVDLFDGTAMKRAAAHLLNAADAMARSPLGRIGDIDILGAEERRAILQDFAGPTIQFPVNRSIPALFGEQVRKTPEALAVIHGDRSLSYQELNTRANRLANTLLQSGLRKGEFVCILLERGADFVTAMLAVFKAGGAYVPLDPTYPEERIGYMLEDSNAPFVISNAALIGGYAAVLSRASRSATLVSLDETIDAAGMQHGFTNVIGPAQLRAAVAEDPRVAVDAADRAYMIYTSGSTGRPKGAMCRHNGALNHLYGELHGLGIEGPFRFLQTAASSSDISVWQFVAPLLRGGASVIVDYDVVVDPGALFESIRRHRVTVAEPVPVVLRALVDHISTLPEESRRLPDLRFMMVTGEALPASLVERWLSLYPHIPIANTYGPTETSDDVTLLVLREPVSSRHAVVPIGRPLPNTHILILGRDGQPVPVGVPGEICIAGIGVGEGYWKQPEKTLLAFVSIPFPAVGSGPMYRSGDLGRWLPDGSIEFLGRLDQQVKVRGFRVEPGEIENTITQHAAIQDAAVVAASDATGTNRLVAYYVVRKHQSIDPAQLRQFLRSRLADYMVPALVRLSALPLTPLGKVDRKAIESLQDEEHIAGAIFESPRSRREEAVADAWCKVLGRQRIGIHENFFEIGGHSLSTIHIISELRKSGLRLAPKQFFLFPTIAALAEMAEASEPLAAVDGEQERALQGWDADKWRNQLEPMLGSVVDAYPLGPTQQGIYLQTVLSAKTSGAYIEQIAFDLSGKLDEDLFGKAWQHVVNSTDVLRTAIIRRGGPQPVQAVVRAATLTQEIVDWRAHDEQGQSVAYNALVEQDRRRGFDLRTPPLMRVTLARLADDRTRVLWTYHHIILDGWSEPLVLAAVFSAYGALREARLPHAETGGRFRDFITRSASQDFSAAQAFWKNQLSGFTSPVSIRDASAAIDPPASAELSHGSQAVCLSPAETSRIEQVARRTKLTLGTIIHGAWALLMHERTGANDVVFGSVSSGRHPGIPHADTLRGVLVNTQPLRSRAIPDTTVSSWLRSLQLTMAEMREHDHTPLGLIQQWCEVPPQKRPMFDTLVVVANYAGSDLAQCHLPDLRISNVAYYTQPLFALTLFVVPGEQLSLQLVYDKKRYASSSVRELLDDYGRILTSIAENPEQGLASLTAIR